jgi:hypothetical protein
MRDRSRCHFHMERQQQGGAGVLSGCFSSGCPRDAATNTWLPSRSRATAQPPGSLRVTTSALSTLEIQGLRGIRGWGGCLPSLYRPYSGGRPNYSMCLERSGCSHASRTDRHRQRRQHTSRRPSSRCGDQPHPGATTICGPIGSRGHPQWPGAEAGYWLAGSSRVLRCGGGRSGK